MSYQLWVGKEVDRYTVPVRGFRSARIYGANLPIALFDLSKVERVNNDCILELARQKPFLNHF